MNIRKMKKPVVNGTMKPFKDLSPQNHKSVCTSTQCPYHAALSSIAGTRLTANSPRSVCLHSTLPQAIQSGVGLLYVTSHMEQVRRYSTLKTVPPSQISMLQVEI